MPSIHKSALVPYAAKAMYELVADVERYPNFLPWCRSTRVRPAGDGEIEACLEVARGPFHHTFTTRNTMVAFERIELRLLDGPFRQLEGYWTFDQLGNVGCRVTLRLHFEFSNRLLRKVFDPLFSEMANSLVNAFSRRAGDVFGST